MTKSVTKFLEREVSPADLGAKMERAAVSGYQFQKYLLVGMTFGTVRGEV